MNFEIQAPATIHLKGLSNTDLLNVYLQGLEKPYFFRVLHKKYPAIKFNLCHPGKYSTTAGTVDKILPLQIQKFNYTLPPKDRHLMKFFEFRKNPTLTGSPARNFTKLGIIETGTKYDTYPFPVRLFILLHEIGHFYYKDEANADAFAAKTFVDLGYNESTALYSLSNVLNFESKRNKDRIETMLYNVQK